MLEDRYPALWQFFGAYLNQDWREDYESPSAALRDFVSGSPKLAAGMPEELDQVLSSTTDDAALEETLLNLGSFFVPSRAGHDPRDWVRGLKDEAQILVQDRG